MLWKERMMYYIDSTNSKEHSYPVYGRQFKTYKWAKPILVGILFAVLYLLAGGLLVMAGAVAANGGTMPSDFAGLIEDLQLGSYDTMDLANGMQTVLSLGSIALMIPVLWIVTKVVRDRPFTSYSSSRGGWSHKVFGKTMCIGLVCVALPIVMWELFHEHHINDFQMRFTIASFLVVTILGPLQCIAEEYVFRGLLMQTLGSWVRLPVIAVILQAALFALAHPYDMIGKMGIFVSGMAFGLAAWLGRGIEVSSAYHICNNMSIFYMQGMNLSSITSESDMEALIFETVIAVMYIAVIFIISRKTNWFNSVRKDDAAAWNEKYDEKIARREAKAAAKAEKRAEKNKPIGAHEESAPGKHFKN